MVPINHTNDISGKTIEMPPKTKSVVDDLEIKDAQLIFNAVWAELEQELGAERLCFPKEIILLGGAPGSGKGTHTRFIQKARGLTCDSVVVSSLLDSVEAKKIKDAGGMVGDREVIGIILRKLLEEEYRDGAILDGFPRTKVQVECLKACRQNEEVAHPLFRYALACSFSATHDSHHGSFRRRKNKRGSPA
jgi:hypothetical protein